MNCEMFPTIFVALRNGVQITGVAMVNLRQHTGLQVAHVSLLPIQAAASSQQLAAAYILISCNKSELFSGRNCPS